MPLLQPEEDSFQKGSFELMCSKIVIRQEAAPTPLRYSGPGLIRQTSDRILTFCVFATSHNRPPFTGVLPLEGEVKAGQIVPGHHYYALKATDLAGRIWSSDRIIIDHDIGSGVVVRGKLQQLESVEQGTPPGNYLRLIIFGDYEIPATAGTQWQETIGDFKRSGCKRNAAVFNACGCQVLLKQEPGKLTIIVESADNAFPLHIETRIIEALQFILGRSVWWSMMTKIVRRAESICLRSEQGNSTAHMNPPISFQGALVGSSVWLLYEKYLQHIWRSRSARLHLISAWLYFVRNAARGSIFTRGLALGVAIEGILHKEFQDAVYLGKRFRKYISDIRKHLEQWDRSANIKRASSVRGVTEQSKIRHRIDTAIGQMLTVRAKDRLLALKKRAIVTDMQIKAWDRLRNESAHATPPDADDKPTLQRWVDLCHTNEVMLYHLIFTAIGYRGTYTDYSTANWPTATFGP